MSNFEHFLSTKKVYLKKLTKKIIFNELFYNCISSTVIYIKKPSIWWPEKYFSHDKMQFFGIFRNYEIKYCFWSFGNTIEIMVIIGRRVLTMPKRTQPDPEFCYPNPSLELGLLLKMNSSSTKFLPELEWDAFTLLQCKKCREMSS